VNPAGGPGNGCRTATRSDTATPPLKYGHTCPSQTKGKTLRSRSSRRPFWQCAAWVGWAATVQALTTARAVSSPRVPGSFCGGGIAGLSPPTSPAARHRRRDGRFARLLRRGGDDDARRRQQTLQPGPRIDRRDPLLEWARGWGVARAAPPVDPPPGPARAGSGSKTAHARLLARGPVLVLRHSAFHGRGDASAEPPPLAGRCNTA
jgi:hypothetical protein